MKLRGITSNNRINFGMPWTKVGFPVKYDKEVLSNIQILGNGVESIVPSEKMSESLALRINKLPDEKRSEAKALFDFIERNSPYHVTFFEKGKTHDRFYAVPMSDFDRVVCSTNPVKRYFNGTSIIPVSKYSNGIHKGLQKLSDKITADNARIEYYRKMNQELKEAIG